jgi:O-antigen/teichoic acid export membrane protein
MSARYVFGSSAAYLAVMIADRTANLLLFPLMTRILTPGDYGVILLIGNGGALINLLFGFSLAQALPTVFSSAGSEPARRAVCTTIMLSIAAIFFIVYLAVMLLSQEISIYFLHTAGYESAIALGALSYFLSGCSLCLILIVRLTERHKLYPMVQIPALILQVGLLIWFIMSASLSVRSQYIATAAAGLFTTIIYVVALRHWLTGRFESRQLFTASHIGLQMLPWQIATLLTTNSAAFFLTRSRHIEEAGLFLVAYGAAGLLIVASSSFDSVWTPFVLLRKDQPDFNQTQIRIFSLYSSALLLGASALSLFAHELFVVLAGPAFREGYRLVPALSLACCIFCFANNFAQGLQARQRTIHYAWIGIVTSVVFLAIAFPLAGIWGASGIIAAMGGGFLTMLLLLQLTSGRLMPVGYPWARHGLMWLTAVAFIAFTYSFDVSWPAAVAKLCVLTAILSLPFLFGAVRVSDVRLAKDSLFTTIR